MSTTDEPTAAAVPESGRMTRLGACGRGLLVAFSIPGLILFSTSIGFGALARDLGITVSQAAYMAAILYALPAQVVLVDQMARGAALLGAAFAVALTAVRLLPMAVTLMPLLRAEGYPRWMVVLAAHFVAITTWLEGGQRLPRFADHLRLPHFIGIGIAMGSMTMLGTVAGYVVAGAVPPLIAAALLFMTPMYFFTSLLVTSRTRMDWAAILAGALLGPPFYLLVPGFDLLTTGLLGGTLAYLAGRRPA
jgi:predicted branched-subunit amino acid permease